MKTDYPLDVKLNFLEQLWEEREKTARLEKLLRAADANLVRFTAGGLLDCHAICDQRDHAVIERNESRRIIDSLRKQVTDLSSLYQRAESNVASLYKKSQLVEETNSSLIKQRNDAAGLYFRSEADNAALRREEQKLKAKVEELSKAYNEATSQKRPEFHPGEHLLNELHRCQNGECTCAWLANEIEVYIEKEVNEAVAQRNETLEEAEKLDFALKNLIYWVSETAARAGWPAKGDVYKTLNEARDARHHHAQWKNNPQK